MTVIVIIRYIKIELSSFDIAVNFTAKLRDGIFFVATIYY